VQFSGSNAAAKATAFVNSCSDIDKLSCAWRELQQVLLPAVGSSSSMANMCDGCESLAAQSHSRAVADDAGSSLAGGFKMSAIYHISALNLIQESPGNVSLSSPVTCSSKSFISQQMPAQCDQPLSKQSNTSCNSSQLLQPAVITESDDGCRQQTSPSAGVGALPASAQTLSTISDLDKTTPISTAVKSLEAQLLPPHNRQSQQSQLVPPHLTQSQDKSLAAGCRTGQTGSNVVVAPALPLPYAHYCLVTEEGVPVERPDKHPFAMARVIHDARSV
jgi:hypothetical protein